MNHMGEEGYFFQLPINHTGKERHIEKKLSLKFIDESGGENWKGLLLPDIIEIQSWLEQWTMAVL